MHFRHKTILFPGDCRIDYGSFFKQPPAKMSSISITDWKNVFFREIVAV